VAVNKAILVGNLGRDPEVRHIPTEGARQIHVIHVIFYAKRLLS
jgi:single-stranded DNA-binding protein